MIHLGQPDPKRAFADLANHPCLVTAQGVRVPVHRVRIRVSAKPQPIDAQKTRYCATASNHHMEVLEVLDKQGNVVKWEGVIVSALEAMKRVRAREPVVNREHSANKRFLFTLSPNDTIELDSPKVGMGKYAIIRSIWMAGSTARLAMTDIRVAHKTRSEVQKAGFLWEEPRINSLRKIGATKVNVYPDGTIQREGPSCQSA